MKYVCLFTGLDWPGENHEFPDLKIKKINISINRKKKTKKPQKNKVSINLVKLYYHLSSYNFTNFICKYFQLRKKQKRV